MEANLCSFFTFEEQGKSRGRNNTHDLWHNVVRKSRVSFNCGICATKFSKNPAVAKNAGFVAQWCPHFPPTQKFGIAVRKSRGRKNKGIVAQSCPLIPRSLKSPGFVGEHYSQSRGRCNARRNVWDQIELILFCCQLLNEFTFTTDSVLVLQLA
jgi:hypothetical protein